MTSLGASAAEAGGGHKSHPCSSSVAAPPLRWLTSEERRIYEQIPRGHENAIKQKYLAATCGISTRWLQRVLKILAETRGLMVASSCGKRSGVFIPVTEKEVHRYMDQLRSRGVSCFVRKAAIERAARRGLLGDVGQAVLDFDAVASRARNETATCWLCWEPLTGRQERFCSEDHKDIWHGRKSA